MKSSSTSALITKSEEKLGDLVKEGGMEEGKERGIKGGMEEGKERGREGWRKGRRGEGS